MVDKPKPASPKQPKLQGSQQGTQQRCAKHPRSDKRGSTGRGGVPIRFGVYGSQRAQYAPLIKEYTLNYKGISYYDLSYIFLN